MIHTAITGHWGSKVCGHFAAREEGGGKWGSKASTTKDQTKCFILANVPWCPSLVFYAHINVMGPQPRITVSPATTESPQRVSQRTHTPRLWMLWQMAGRGATACTHWLSGTLLSVAKGGPSNARLMQICVAACCLGAQKMFGFHDPLQRAHTNVMFFQVGFTPHCLCLFLWGEVCNLFLGGEAKNNLVPGISRGNIAYYSTPLTCPIRVQK